MSNGNIFGEEHIINLIESADAISMLIRKVGNYGGKLEYRQEKLRELADALRSPPPATENAELVRKLRHLISLNDPSKGGPYQGLAANEVLKAMNEAVKALSGNAT